jgi:hypothetical protein
LLDFKKLAGFDQAAISEIHPMHDPSGKLQYYEVKFSSPANHDNGYAVISATTADMPVVEFSEQGPTHFERLRNKIGHDTFRMVRFSPSFVAAEDNAGKPLAEIGRRPVIIPAELQTAMRAEAKAKAGEPPVTTGVLATPELVRLRKGQLSTSIPYATFKQRFVQPRPKTARLDPAWALALEPHHNPGCTLNYFWADGLHNHPFYLQIPKNTPPNNNDHASGCGPAAWLNLFGWHDFNWRPELLSAQHMYNDPYINNLTMACHDHIGTYEPWFTFGADQGFTWPGDMPKGYDFARVHLHHDCGYWWRQDWWNTDEP